MNNMLIQGLITAAIVVLAGLFLVRHMIAMSRPGKGGACGTGCSACSKTDLLEKRLSSLEES
jgi:hypothetical protein